jgi:acetoin utilization protein AcuC
MSSESDSPVGPRLVFGAWSTRYDLGPGHPLTPRRFGPGIDLVRAAAGSPPAMLAPEPVEDVDLAQVHLPRYIDVVRRPSVDPGGMPAAGLGPGDTPAFPGMHDAAAAVAGGSIRAVEEILAGRTSHAFHPGGGLHHAMPGRAAGFCVYNDPALAIAVARRAGCRVLYVDLDVHHGDGVQAIHWDDPGVMTFSIHQSGETLFPGSGFVDELGEGVAAGTAINLPLDPFTGEAGWIEAIRTVLPVVAAAFGPDIVISQHGADAHAWDPLANLRVTTTAMGEAARIVDGIAHRWAGGRWLATGGGGYDAYRVVPRVWSLVWLAQLHREGDQPTPAAWRNAWAIEAERYGQSPLPERLEDVANAGLPIDARQVAADASAASTAGVVRSLVVPALLRTAVDRGWWRPEAPRPTGPIEPAAPWPATASARPPGPPSTRPEIVAAVDATHWGRLVLAPGVIAPHDPLSAHALISAALRDRDVRVTAAIADGTVVGAAVSAAAALGDATGDVGETRSLLAVGVAPAWRGHGLARALLAAHLEGVEGVEGVEGADGAVWVAEVTLAERDVVAPLPRAMRAAAARRLLEGAGFRLEPARRSVLVADPGAFVARRG